MDIRVKKRDLIGPLTLVFMFLLLMVLSAMQHSGDSLTMSANADRMAKAQSHKP